MVSEKRELQWKGRLPVWTCQHLWLAAMSGNPGARGAIADAAVNMALDAGENVALCGVCGSERYVSMTHLWVNTVWLDGNHQVITAVSERKDGPALPGFDVPGVVSKTVASEG